MLIGNPDSFSIFSTNKAQVYKSTIAEFLQLAMTFWVTWKLLVQVEAVLAINDLHDMIRMPLQCIISLMF